MASSAEPIAVTLNPPSSKASSTIPCKSGSSSTTNIGRQLLPLLHLLPPNSLSSSDVDDGRRIPASGNSSRKMFKSEQISLVAATRRRDPLVQVRGGFSPAQQVGARTECPIRVDSVEKVFFA